jgi:hypothetical protein
MRHWLVGAAVLLAGAGCGPTRPPAPPAPPAPRAAAPAEGERMYLDVAMIEVPPGDWFVNEGLWELGDEQCVALDVKPVLEENGLRVCQIGGLLPERLQALLSARRSCPSPRRLRAEADLPTPVQVGPRRERIDFRVLAGGGEREVKLIGARCVLEVVPAPAEDGGLALRFQPRIQHGQVRRTPRVDRDASGALSWSMEAREPVEDFPELRWAVPAGASEYVVIGARLDRENTIGPALFLADEDGPPRQRLLVLRLARQGGETPPDGALRRAPPVALQAGWGQARDASR